MLSTRLSDFIPRELYSRRYGADPESAYAPAGLGGNQMAGEADRPVAGKRRVERRRFITDDAVDKIVEIVRHWSQLPITWENIRLRIGVEIFDHGDKPRKDAPTVWSRQALSTNVKIKAAYNSRRRELLDEEKKGKRLRTRQRAPEVVLLKQQVDHLQIEVAQLREKLAEYEAVFRRYQLNKFLGETSEDGLLKPLSTKIERGQEDK